MCPPDAGCKPGIAPLLRTQTHNGWKEVPVLRLAAPSMANPQHRRTPGQEGCKNPAAVCDVMGEGRSSEQT